MDSCTIASAFGNLTCVDVPSATAKVERLTTSYKIDAIVGGDYYGYTTAILQNVATSNVVREPSAANPDVAPQPAVRFLDNPPAVGIEIKNIIAERELYQSQANAQLHLFDEKLQYNNQLIKLNNVRIEQNNQKIELNNQIIG